MQTPSLYSLSVNLRIYDVLLVTRVFCIINTKERIEWRNMKAQWRLMKTHFPTEISSILKIDHRTTNGVC
jgi:hypothetical protein